MAVFFSAWHFACYVYGCTFHPNGKIVLCYCHCFVNLNGTSYILFFGALTLLIEARNERVKIGYFVINLTLLHCMMWIFPFHPSGMEAADSYVWRSGLSHTYQWDDLRNGGWLLSALSRFLLPPTCLSSKGFRWKMCWTRQVSEDCG